MEINRINLTPIASTELKKKADVVKDSGLKDDKFENSLTPNFVLEELSKIKERDGKTDKFRSQRVLDEIKKSLTDEPKKCEIALKLAPQKNIKPLALRNILELPYDTVKDVSYIATKKDSKNNLKLPSSEDITTVYQMKPEDIKKVRTLMDTPLTGSNAIMAVQEPTKIDCDKLVAKINDLTKTIDKDNLDGVVFAKDKFSKGEYTLSVKEREIIDDDDDDEESYSEPEIKIVYEKTEMLDSKLNTQAVEVKKSYKSQNGKEYQIKKVKDIKNNTVAKTRYEVNSDDIPVLTHEVRLVKNKNGKVVRTEYTEPSDIKGVFNIKKIQSNGKIEQVSMGKVDAKTGITTVKKDMTSPLGTRTQYLYEDDPQGNRILDYKITDKKGNVLLNNSESFEVVNDKKFISSKNGHKYEMTVNDDNTGITVKDLQNPKRVASFVYDNDIVGKQDLILQVLKQMSGEELFKLKQATNKLVGISNELGSRSINLPEDRSIETSNNLFIILHELGHACDDKDVDALRKKQTEINALHNDKKFNEIYEKEKKAFNKAYPDTQRNHIAYFLNQESHYLGKTGALAETIAESNALLSTPKSHEIFAIRSQYLQQNFPETIAYLDKKLALE